MLRFESRGCHDPFVVLGVVVAIMMTMMVIMSIAMMMLTIDVQAFWAVF